MGGDIAKQLPQVSSKMISLRGNSLLIENYIQCLHVHAILNDFSCLEGIGMC